MPPDAARDVLNTRAAQAGVTDVGRTGSGTPLPTAGWPVVGRSGT
jgi:hypothetical protein